LFVLFRFVLFNIEPHGFDYKALPLIAFLKKDSTRDEMLTLSSDRPDDDRLLSEPELSSEADSDRLEDSLFFTPNARSNEATRFSMSASW